MHWLKTKIKHILYNNFTDSEFTKFMKIRALTCQLGEIPKEYQLMKVCTKKLYESIVNKLLIEGQSLTNLLQKDIEDASDVEAKRDYWKRKKRQQREKSDDVQLDGLGQSQQEIILDKTIVDKSILNTNTYAFFQNAWNASMPNKLLKLSDNRKNKLKARLNKDKDFEKHFELCLQKISESDFLSGKKGDWKASFDWLIDNDNNYIKVLENNYKNEQAQSSAERTMENARKAIERINS